MSRRCGSHPGATSARKPGSRRCCWRQRRRAFRFVLGVIHPGRSGARHHWTNTAWSPAGGCYWRTALMRHVADLQAGTDWRISSYPVKHLGCLLHESRRYRLLAEAHGLSAAPGVTESGSATTGTIKSIHRYWRPDWPTVVRRHHPGVVIDRFGEGSRGGTCHIEVAAPWAPRSQRLSPVQRAVRLTGDLFYDYVEEVEAAVECAQV